MTGALVTDVDMRNVLAGLRALGRAGVPTVAVAPSRTAAGMFSRHATERRRAPDVTRDPGGFTAAVADAARRHAPVVVFPGREESIDVLVAAAEALPEGAVLAYPGADSLRVLRNKDELALLAGRAGVRTPETLARGTARELRVDPPPAPCVVKPLAPGHGEPQVALADTSAAIDEFLGTVGSETPVIAQEHVAGTLIALALVIDRDGQVVARFQQRTLRTWPPQAGTASLAVGTPVDPELVDRGAALLRAAGHWGFAQLQFIDGDGDPCLIDVNVGFPGSLPLALASGVNLPAAWHAVADGSSPQADTGYRTGVTYRWLEADVLAALRGQPRVLLTRPPGPRASAVWAADDPLAGLAYAASAVARRLRPRRRSA